MNGKYLKGMGTILHDQLIVDIQRRRSGQYFSCKEIKICTEILYFLVQPLRISQKHTKLNAKKKVNF